jgi:hypothetical protein
MRIIHVLVSTLALVVACGGGTETEDTTTNDVARDQTVGEERVEEPPAEVSAEPEPEPEPVPSGPVDVTVRIVVGGEEVQGSVALANEAGETAAEGNAGETFNVQSGFYQITATIADESVLIDTPTRTEETQIPAGDAQTIDVEFPRARVRLNVTRNGRPLRHPEITLFRQGSEEPSATFRVSDEHVPISPGRYEADVKLRGHEIRVRGLTFMDGATQNIPVNIE